MKKKFIADVFSKNIYLLGKDTNAINYWLESPSFDCNWYWGFGYVETYTNNNNPKLSADINSHSHIQFNDKNFFDCEKIKETVYNSKEKQQLKKLFVRFYKLEEKAEKAYRKDVETWKQLNVVDIPKVMNKIIKILTPEGEEPIVYNIKEELKTV